MSENCNHNCSDCAENCGERTDPQSFLKQPHELSDIKKVIGVVSGKGGVGKSLVTSLLATLLQRRGHKTAILDADVTGPSIPKIFGIKEKTFASDMGWLPARTKTGIEMISVNLLLDDDTEPVVWRGPVISGVVTQFWTEVIWNNVDYMLVDMPPGTGDVPLTVFQSLPVDGIIMVTSPQELVEMIVGKAVKMAGMLEIPILGIVENMSYFACPDCGGKHHIFGESRIEDMAEKFGIDTISKIPITPDLATLCDGGNIEQFNGAWLDNMAERIENLIK